MSRKRKALLVVFIVVSVAGMWARYAYQKSERERMERLVRDLSRMQREQEMQRLYPTPTPTPADAFEETRDAFSGERPRETLEAIRQAVGRDFKLMELRFDEERTTALVSTDGKGVEQYTLRRGRKVTEGPSAVNVVGDNPLADSLYEQKAIDLDLMQKLAQDAVARSGIEGGRVSSAKLAYEYVRYKGDPPVWTFVVERGTPPDWAHKFVSYDAKGKFKSVF